MQINKTQIKQIQTICATRFNDRDERLYFMSNFFDQQLSSTKDLTEIQADELIYYLRTGILPTNRSWGFFNLKDGQHRALISRCHTLGWVDAEKRHIVDINRLGGWLKSKRSPVQKPLKKMTATEVSKVIAALDSMIKKQYK